MIYPCSTLRLEQGEYLEPQEASIVAEALNTSLSDKLEELIDDIKDEIKYEVKESIIDTIDDYDPSKLIAGYIF